MKRMMLGMALAGLLGLAGQAQAGVNLGQNLAPGSPPAGNGSDPTFNFAFTSNDGSVGAFGTLTATPNGDGTYTATVGNITIFGAPAAGGGTLIANPAPTGEVTSPSGFFFYDDQLLPGQNPLITLGGLLFDVGGVEVNIFSNGPGPGTYQFYENNGFNLLGNFALTPVASVPEPSSLILCGLGGLATLVGVRVRRRKVATPA